MSAWDDLVATLDEATQKEIAEAESKTLNGQLLRAYEVWIELWHISPPYRAAQWCADRPWVYWPLFIAGTLYVGASCVMTAMGW